MDTSLKMETISCLEPVWRGSVCRELTEEYVVPDSMPDVGEVLDTQGILTMTGRDTEAGGVQMSAALAVCVVYAPEGESGLRALEMTIPVNVRLDATGADADCRTVSRLRLRSLETKVINSRKLSLRAETEAEAECWRNGELATAVGMEDENTAAHVRMEETEVLIVSDVREKTFAVTDEYALPAALGESARILSRRTELLLEEMKHISGKALLRGRVRSELLFSDAAWENPVFAQYETEFSQLMEVDALDGAEVQPEVVLFLTGAFFDMPGPGQESGRLQAEFHLGAQCVCREKRRLNSMTDVYSNRTSLSPHTESMRLTGSCRTVMMRQTLADRIEAVDREAELISASCSVIGVIPEEGCVKTSVSVRLLCRRRDGRFTSARGRLSAEFTLPDIAEETLRDMDVSMTDIYAVPGTGDVRVSLRLDAYAEKETEVVTVTAVEEDEADFAGTGRTPSVILARVPEGTDLWNLARRCRSTVEDILLVNEGRCDGLLLIPKGR